MKLHKSLPPVNGAKAVNKSEVDYIHDHLCCSKLQPYKGVNHEMDIFSSLLNLLSEVNRPDLSEFLHTVNKPEFHPFRIQ